MYGTLCVHVAGLICMVGCVYVLPRLFTYQFEGVLSIVPVTDIGEAMSEQNLKKDGSWH